MAKAKPTSVTLESDVKDALTRAAKEDDRSVSSLVERIVKAWLRDRGYLPASEAPAPAADEDRP